MIMLHFVEKEILQVHEGSRSVELQIWVGRA